MVGAFVVQLLLTFFFMPESHFDRSTLAGSSIASTAGEESGPDEKKLASDKVSSGSATTPVVEKANSYLHDLRAWSGYYDSSNFLRNLVSPFFMLASPIVVWGAMMFNICISWLVLLTITLSQIFSGPPYNFSVTSVGLTSLSSFIATLIATAFSGLAVDGLVKFMSRKNNGIYGTSMLCSPLLKPLLINRRAGVPPPHHQPLPPPHRQWLLRLGPEPVQCRPLADSRHRLHGYHQPRRPIRHHGCCDLRR